MRTWDIAKLLIESCNSPEDVEEAIEILSAPEAARRVCDFMAVFASYEPTVSHVRVDLPLGREGREEGKHVLTGGDNKTALEEDGESTTVWSSEASVDQLRSLFRTCGMTNKQVEEWMTDKFGVQFMVGKGALREYLARVLASVDSALANRVMTAAQSLENNNSPSTGSHTAERPSRQKAEGHGSAAKVVGETDDGKIEGQARLSSIDASAAQLEALFRTIGMTNKQVEQWMTDSFGVQVLVSKDSLHKYLAKVLGAADLGLTNRLLASAQRLAIAADSPASDIKEYWDQLDKHFATVE